jgi:hypothetical protein
MPSSKTIKNNTFFFLIFFVTLSQSISAQDSLNTTFNKNNTSAFASTRIINAQTTETLRKRTLDFRIAHRFGNFLPYTDKNGVSSGRGGFHNFYGLDDPNFDIRIAFEYGITDRLMVGISRSKKDENIETLIKYKLLQQTENDKIPLSIALFVSSAYTPQRDPLGIFQNTSDRFTYTAQAIATRKFSSRLSLELISSFIHRNLISNPLDNKDIFSLGGGGRCKLTKHFAIIADYFYNFRNKELNGVYYNPLSAGVEIESGGHVFSIMFTNAQNIIEPEFITNTTDSWLKNGWKLSFNISRIFRL